MGAGESSGGRLFSWDFVSRKAYTALCFVPPLFPLVVGDNLADNLAANFSRELADYIIYIIDVSGGDKIPRKGGPGITQADLLVRTTPMEGTPYPPTQPYMHACLPIRVYGYVCSILSSS